MTCRDCGQATLSDGVCIDCSNKRFDDYPRLKAIELRLQKRLAFIEKAHFKDSNYDVELSNIYSILGLEQPTPRA